MFQIMTFVLEHRAANLLRQVRWRDGVYCPCCRTESRILAVYTYIRFNTSLRQLDVEIDVSYKTIYRRVQRFLRALDAPLPHLEGPVEIDELYVKAGLKGRERDQPSRSRGLSTRGRGTYNKDKPPVLDAISESIQFYIVQLFNLQL